MSNSETPGGSKVVQFLTLLLGGGAAGLLGSVLSNAVEWQKVEAQAALTNQDFVNKYLTYVIDKDLDTRIRIAEYFQFILQDDDHRARWKQYLVAIEEKRDKWTPEYLELLDKQEKGPLNRDEDSRLAKIAKYFGEAEKLRIGVAKEAPKAAPPIAPSPAAQQLAECARSQVGVAEKPPEFDEFIRSVGLDPDTQKVPGWSDAFISWCINKVAPSLKLSPNLRQLWLSAQKKKLVIRPPAIRETSDIRIGDIYVMGRMAIGGGIVVDVTEKPKFVGVEGIGDSVNLTQRDLRVLPFFWGLIRLTDEGVDQGVATATDQPPRVERQGNPEPPPTPNPSPTPNPTLIPEPSPVPNPGR